MNRAIGMLVLIVAFAGMTLLSPGLRAEEHNEGDDFEPPPEGFTEQTYPLSDLMRPIANLSGENEESNNIVPLNINDIKEILKTSVAPDTWRAHGPARMDDENGVLIVLQKKEVHEELAKVLDWLRESAAPAFHGTVVVAAMKPEALQKYTDDPAPIEPADLQKAIEDAGAAAHPEFFEINGAEGQRISVGSSVRHRYLGDIDVAGAVYDPVLRTAVEGLRIQALGMRTPDCKNVHVEIRAAFGRDLKFDTAKVKLALVATQTVQNSNADADKDKGKKDGGDKKDADAKDKKKSEETFANDGLNKEMTLSLPALTAGGFAATVEVPQGKFALAGTLDLGLIEKGEKLAVFVRPNIGTENVATLLGVSGLKEGESFRLYPLLAMLRGPADYPAPNFFSRFADQNMFSNLEAAPTANAYAPRDPFVSGAPSATGESMRRAKMQFQEKVRMNKIVEPRGSFVFTRLKDDDHAKMAARLTSDLHRAGAPVRAHVLLVALSPESSRKLMFSSSRVFDGPALNVLIGAPGSETLVDEALTVAMNQRSFVFAGHLREYVADYDINGDSYDPATDRLLDRGFVLDLRPMPTASGKSTDVEIRLAAVPGAAEIKRSTVDAFSVSSGAEVNLVLGIGADLDLPHLGLLDLRQTVRAPFGQYIIVGATQMPPGVDGKPDPRQAVLFLRTVSEDK